MSISGSWARPAGTAAGDPGGRWDIREGGIELLSESRNVSSI